MQQWNCFFKKQRVPPPWKVFQNHITLFCSLSWILLSTRTSTYNSRSPFTPLFLATITNHRFTPRRCYTLPFSPFTNFITHSNLRPEIKKKKNPGTWPPFLASIASHRRTFHRCFAPRLESRFQTSEAAKTAARYRFYPTQFPCNGRPPRGSHLRPEANESWQMHARARIERTIFLLCLASFHGLIDRLVSGQTFPGRGVSG